MCINKNPNFKRIVHYVIDSLRDKDNYILSIIHISGATLMIKATEERM